MSDYTEVARELLCDIFECCCQIRELYGALVIYGENNGGKVMEGGTEYMEQLLTTLRDCIRDATDAGVHDWRIQRMVLECLPETVSQRILATA